MEILLNQFFSPVPVSLALTQSFNSPLLLAADIYGSIGITYILFVLSLLLFRFLSQGYRNLKAFTLILFIAGLYAGFDISYTNKNNITKVYETVKIGFINPALSFKDGIQFLITPEFFEKKLQDYLDTSHMLWQLEKPELIIWPEGTVKSLDLTSAYAHQVFNDFTRKTQASLLISGYEIRKEARSKTTETLVQLYYKNTGLYRTLKKATTIPLVENKHKKIPQLNQLIKIPDTNLSFGALICYEGLKLKSYKDILLSKEANYLVLSSSAFFERKNWAVIFASILSLRAAEINRPITNISNMGINVAFDQNGQIKKSYNNRKQTVGFFRISKKEYPVSFYFLYHIKLFILIGFVSIMYILWWFWFRFFAGASAPLTKKVLITHIRLPR